MDNLSDFEVLLLSVWNIEELRPRIQEKSLRVGSMMLQNENSQWLN